MRCPMPSSIAAVALCELGAVSQYGSCENVNAVAIEVRSAAQMRINGFNGALYAFFGHGASSTCEARPAITL